MCVYWIPQIKWQGSDNVEEKSKVYFTYVYFRNQKMNDSMLVYKWEWINKIASRKSTY